MNRSAVVNSSSMPLTTSRQDASTKAFVVFAENSLLSSMRLSKSISKRNLSRWSASICCCIFEMSVSSVESCWGEGGEAGVATLEALRFAGAPPFGFICGGVRSMTCNVPVRPRSGVLPRSGVRELDRARVAARGLAAGAPRERIPGAAVVGG